ncbi:TPA: hypothetical protein ACGJQ8_005459 [Pseudomonas aeruginosa]|uniref:hypothetical protein n=1 Tax=Pseudomonas aeruginosa TaxID=287 RepID=UPI00053D63F4|nr:hypothetical protein [Pseudomonas aeruginosa]HCL2710546.1 hypothetical protein [Pseudomonas aeruginosa EF8E]EKV0902632.1 hypothetical protein [Pseudomonas aeruginosa]KSC16359.1 hypothetical protein AO878_10365 [Pseudomonas aeruginosa]KSQ70276.1 hypothetical protein APB44_25270 [Pseudomonas aeruginosa]MBG6449370.1 hypothetical protein [Pseudomonas aeruginosa]
MTRQSVLATGPEARDWWRFGSGDEPACELFFAGGRSLAASRKPAAAPRGMAVAEQASGQDAAPGLRAFDLLPGNPPKNP